MSFTGISTLLPVYLAGVDSDSLRRLRRAASSVLTQECSLPLELVVVDDGSARPLNELPELADLLARQEVSYIRMASNQGLVFALNAGLNRARHDLIARIDADDYWRPEKLNKQLEALISDPDLTIIGTGMRMLGEDGWVTDHVRGSSWQEVLNFYASVGCPLPHGSILARKDIFSLLGGYSHSPNYRHCEDFALWGVWLRFFKAAVLEEVLFEYTVSESQVSTKHAGDQRAASGRVHRRFLELKNHQAIPAALTETARILGKSLIQTGKILYVAWQYYDYILVDDELYEPLRTLLPDRRVHPYREVVDLLAGRFFYLHKNDHFEPDIADHASCVHDISHIQPLLR